LYAVGSLCRRRRPLQVVPAGRIHRLQLIRFRL